jgi:hypothetical protein
VPLIVRGLVPMVMTAATASNPVGAIDDAWGLTVVSPPSLTASQVSVQVELTDTGTNFVTLQSGGVDVTLTANKATVISPVPFRQIQISSTASETATFQLSKAILV